MRTFYRNFIRIGEINVSSINQSLFKNPDLWNQHRFRTTFPNTPHVDVDDIWIRFSSLDKCDTTTNVIGDLTNVWYPAITKLPEVKDICLNLMRAVGAYELGRVLITRIPPGGIILPHADVDGDYVNTMDRMRYHVVLQGSPGSMYRTGDETVNMRTGEIWAFNALLEHEVYNHSADDRIHLLIDVVLWPTEIK